MWVRALMSSGETVARRGRGARVGLYLGLILDLCFRVCFWKGEEGKGGGGSFLLAVLVRWGWRVGVKMLWERIARIVVGVQYWVEVTY